MESNEGLEQKRNIERDKRIFTEAVETTSIEEIETVFDDTAVAALANNLKDTKLFILGEVHGVKENVDVIYTFFKKFGFRQLALEWEPELHDTIEKFLESGEVNFDAIQDSPDGRITAGHFALIKKLKSEKLLEGFICFDGGSGGAGWNARDSSMAKNIIENISNVPILVVAGSRHTKLETYTFDDEPGDKHPMGENVKKEIPNVTSGNIEYQSGKFHNFGIQEFVRLEEYEELSHARFYQDENGCYVFELPEAHAAIVPNPDESDESQEENLEIELLPATSEDTRRIYQVQYEASKQTYPNAELGITVDDVEDWFKNELTEQNLLKEEERIKNLPQDLNKQSFVAKHEGKVIGFCHVSKNENRNQIEGIYILPEFQGAGLGKKFWISALDFFDTNKDIRVMVTPYNTQAIEFYKSLGFELTGKQDYEGDGERMKSGSILPFPVEMLIKVDSK